VKRGSFYVYSELALGRTAFACRYAIHGNWANSDPDMSGVPHVADFWLGKSRRNGRDTESPTDSSMASKNHQVKERMEDTHQRLLTNRWMCGGKGHAWRGGEEALGECEGGCPN
jgi:hypothetical protein